MGEDEDDENKNYSNVKIKEKMYNLKYKTENNTNIKNENSYADLNDDYMNMDNLDNKLILFDNVVQDDNNLDYENFEYENKIEKF